MKIIRPIFFCVLCATTLAVCSGLMKQVATVWSQHLLLLITIIVTYLLTLLFTKWEKLPPEKAGVVASKSTPKKLLAGFATGFVLASLQPVIVLLFGHYTMHLSSAATFTNIIFYFLLYGLVAMREELAFRGYPLFSLYYSVGMWPAQLIIFIIFSLEHGAGGMTWLQAFAGAGTGALLFGIAAIRTKGIAVPVGIHMAWNFGQWCFGFKPEAGIFTGVAETGFKSYTETNAWISYLLIMVAAIIIFYFYKSKQPATTM